MNESKINFPDQGEIWYGGENTTQSHDRMIKELTTQLEANTALISDLQVKERELREDNDKLLEKLCNEVLEADLRPMERKDVRIGQIVFYREFNDPKSVKYVGMVLESCRPMRISECQVLT